MGFGVWGLGFGVWVSGLRVQGWGCEVYTLNQMGEVRYRGYSKSRTHTAIGPYGRSIPRSIGPS